MKTFLAVSCVTLAVLAAAASPAAAKPLSAQMNSTAYWEAYTPEDDTCTKADLGDGFSGWTLPSTGGTYTLLVLKAGSGDGANDVIAYPVAGVEYTHTTGKDLSHVIVCSGSGTTTS